MLGENNKFQYGFLYPILTALVGALRCLNLVELFKLIAKKLAPAETDVRAYSSTAIDIFITIKWILVAGLWVTETTNPLSIALVIYLITMNIFTYFDYHVWSPAFDGGEENRRRRFVKVLLAVLFNLLCFGYLYAVPFQSEFILSSEVSVFFSSLMLSLARMLFIDTGFMSPGSAVGEVVVITESMTAFIFIVIILSASLPNLSALNNKKD